MDKPWKVITAFIGVFVAGAIFGGVFTVGLGKRVRAEVVKAHQSAPAPTPAVTTPATTTPPTAKDRDHFPKKSPVANAGAANPPANARGFTPGIMRQLTKRLNPTPEQRKAIQQIVTRADEDWQRSGREHIAEVERVTVRMYEDVSALLSPEQRVQLEKMRQETLEKARQERMKRMAPQQPQEQPKEGANIPGALPLPPKSAPSSTKE
jgi:Spy/CpxP family protein refolding chaperone